MALALLPGQAGDWSTQLSAPELRPFLSHQHSKAPSGPMMESCQSFFKSVELLSISVLLFLIWEMGQS